MNPAEPSPLFTQEQFRMRRLEVYNWGTFSGLHDIPIAEEGYLFVGKSGCGKSTLLDALSALLIPPRWVDFNAAAREAERAGHDRNLVSYIRGAWAEQKDTDSGEIATRFLRNGTTWSAIAVTFRNGFDRTVVLVQVLWLRGSTNALSDVKRHYLIFERSFDLQEMQGFDLDVRKLKQHFAETFSRDEFRPYCERFCRLVGIESDMALRLLHKTQSAKSLGDLNTLLRNFMLDKPATFDVADRLVAEFAVLNAAHQAVVKAREQVECLGHARKKYGQLQTLQANRVELETCRTGVSTYRETLRMRLLERSLSHLQIDAEGADGLVKTREGELTNQEALRNDLQRQHRDIGGDRLEQWEIEKRGLETLRIERSRKRADTSAVCEELGWSLPESPQLFADLVGKARIEVETWHRDRSKSRDHQVSLATEKQKIEQDFAAAVREVQALRRQPSNIDAAMLDLRAEIAAAIGVHETVLPFVGELIEVLFSESGWRGAIERVLHGFAMSLLVDEQHYAALSSYINATNLEKRLVYYRTARSEQTQQRPVASNSLVLKLQVKDGAYSDWLRAELRHRFDYVCVDSLAAFRAADRALTREGQVKHSRARHEKDDRTQVDDRSQWVLGFDNREKLALFERRAQLLAERIAKLQSDLKKLLEEESQSANRAMACQRLANMQWQEIDLGPIVDRISDLDTQIRRTKAGNPQLQELSRRLEQQSTAVERAEQALRGAKVALEGINKTIRETEERLRQLKNEPAEVALTDGQEAALELRFAAVQLQITLDNLDRATTSVVQALAKEEKEVSDQINRVERSIEDIFADFKRRWPTDAADMDATLASAQDFLSMLARLETDGLPAHEQHFFDLLRNQSHQNLAALSSHISQARKTILEGMDLVNESLRQAEFNPGTFLQIEATDRQLQEVRDFKHDIQQALSYAWTDDREIAEARFVTLQGIVDRLGSQEADQKRWRDLVLDVRQHVEFIGREFTPDGVEVEVYRSGAGKSGGQRQKLATTCLAAALRFQLGGHDHGIPIYAPVVLDEAFDKADNEFTDLSVKIFVNFGFQMIVATPLKAVMTLEPYIGGACFIEIAGRQRSGVLLIDYDKDERRLKLPERARREVTAGEVS
jgi:uncharacterized protein YPO0396